MRSGQWTVIKKVNQREKMFMNQVSSEDNQASNKEKAGNLFLDNYLHKDTCCVNNYIIWFVLVHTLFSWIRHTKTEPYRLVCLAITSSRTTLIKNKIKLSSFIRKFRGIGCKVIYD